MNTVILNRAGKLPEDGWYQIEVPGEHINHEAKVVQVIDDKAVASILNRFQAEAAKPNFAGVLIDRDHFSLDEDSPTEAMGWALELRNRAGLPEARIDWTAAGRPKVEGKDYKFFSTVYDVKDVELLGTRIVNGKPYKLVRPLRLDRLALTNDPNNKGGKPISNRDGKSAGAAETQPDTKMKNLMKALGLAEDASEESAVAAVQVITNRVTTAEGKVTTLTSERDALLTAQVESDLEKYKNRFKPEHREKFKSALIANRKGTLELLEAMEAPAENKGERPITNRRIASAPAAGATATDEEKFAQAEEARAAKISNRARAIRAQSPSLSLSQAYEQAEQEIATEAK